MVGITRSKVFVQRVLRRNWGGRGLQGYMTSFGHRFDIVLDIVFPECVAKGSRLTWESEGRAVFAGRCFPVRNRPQPFASVRIRALWHCCWGEL